jgi:hypothetical protein
MKIRSGEQGRVGKVGSGNFQDARRACKIGQCAQIVTHTARRCHSREKIATHHCFGKLPIRRRCQMLMRIDEAGQRVLILYVDDLRAGRNFQLSCRQNSFDAFAAHDDGHVRPKLGASPVDYRRARIYDDFYPSSEVAATVKGRPLKNSQLSILGRRKNATKEKTTNAVTRPGIRFM